VLIAVDIDGTIDAFPGEFQTILSCLRASGHYVVIISGGDSDPVDQTQLDGRVQQLTALGLADAYDEIVLVPQPHDEAKATFCKARQVDVLFDNSKKNAKAYAATCNGPAFVPWQTRK
jgi:hypothetical protein